MINKDDIELIQDVLERNYFNFFRKGTKEIEFILNNNCNQNCKNCFSCSYDKDMYKEQNMFAPTKDDKYTNLSNLINWYIKNNFSCKIIFRGCIEQEDDNQLLQSCEEMCQKLISNNIFPEQILFETKGANIKLLESILNIFQEKFFVTFIFNIDGPYCDNKNETDYKQILNFIIDNNTMINAKINAHNVKQWIKNYKWWIVNLGFDNLNKLHLSEMLDDSWDFNSLQQYTRFLDFQVDILSENIPNFKNYIFNNKLNFTTIQIIDQKFLTNKRYYQSCAFHEGLSIDLSTLKIPACTKLNYPIFHVGEFDDNLNINPINISILIAKAHLKKSCTPHCEYCYFLNLCEKTCYGENFKVSYNPTCPIKNSCNMIAVKYNFLFFKYNAMNLLNLDDYDLNKTFKSDLQELIKYIIKQEKQND